MFSAHSVYEGVQRIFGLYRSKRLFYLIFNRLGVGGRVSMLTTKIEI